MSRMAVSSFSFCNVVIKLIVEEMPDTHKVTARIEEALGIQARETTSSTQGSSKNGVLEDFHERASTVTRSATLQEIAV